MSHILHLNIGDTVFCTHSSTPMDRIYQGGNSHYSSFEKLLSGTTNGATPNINVCIKHEEQPSAKGYQKLYASPDSWEFYSNKTGYALTLQPPATKRPLWTTVADKSFSNVSIYLDDHLSPHYPLRYPLDQIILFHHLAQRQGAIIHSAGMTCNGKGYLFPGISGAGKTTLTNALTSCKAFHFLSDDRIIVRHTDDGYRCYGTPWPGDAGIAENKNATLAGIFFLRQAAANKITEISPRQAFEQFMPVASIPWYHEAMLNALFDFFQQLVRDVPVFDLHFSPTPALGDFFEQAIA